MRKRPCTVNTPRFRPMDQKNINKINKSKKGKDALVYQLCAGKFQYYSVVRLIFRLGSEIHHRPKSGFSAPAAYPCVFTLDTA